MGLANNLKRFEMGLDNVPCPKAQRIGIHHFVDAPNVSKLVDIVWS